MFKPFVLGVVALAASLRIPALWTYPETLERFARSLLLVGFLGHLLFVGPMPLEYAIAFVAALIVQARIHRLASVAKSVLPGIPAGTEMTRGATRALSLAVIRTVVLGALAWGVAMFAAGLALLAPVPVTSVYTGLVLGILAVVTLALLALRPWLRSAQGAA